MSAVSSRKGAIAAALLAGVLVLTIVIQFVLSRDGSDPGARLPAPFACGDSWMVEPIELDPINGWTMTPGGDQQLTGSEPIYASDRATVSNVVQDNGSLTLTLDYGSVFAVYSGLAGELSLVVPETGEQVIAGQPLGRRATGRAVEIRFWDNRTGSGVDDSPALITFEGSIGGAAVVSTNCQGEAAQHLRQSSPPDFDGDGVADRLDVVGKVGRVSFGTGSEPVVLSSPIDMSEIAVGDFDGDGSSDLFWADGDRWRLASGAIGEWEELQGSRLTVDELLFGDLNGDGRTDVFVATGETWRYASGGTERWNGLRRSAVLASDLTLADFDGDGFDDVFQATGTLWRYSARGIGPWARLSSSQFTEADLRFGDYDGDGKTDVLRSGDGTLHLAWAGRPGWTNLAIPFDSATELFTQDRDLDGRVEIVNVVDQ